MVLLKSHNSLDLKTVDKVSSSNKEKTNKLYKHYFKNLMTKWSLDW